MKMTKVLAVVTVLCLMAGTAQAYVWNNATTWTAGAPGTLETAGNWDNGAPAGNLWGGGGYDPDIWWDSTDGYIGAGADVTVSGDNLRGNNNPFEIFVSGGTVSTGYLMLQMCRIRQTGGSWTNSSNYYLSRNGGYTNGAGAPLSSAHFVSGSASLSVDGDMSLNSDGFQAFLKVSGGGSVTVGGKLVVQDHADGQAEVTVQAGGTLDVDGNIEVNAGGLLLVGYQGTCTAGGLVISGTGLVVVASNSMVLDGDVRDDMTAYIGSFNLIGEVLPDLVGGNTVITPEPATLGLLAVGGLGVLLRRRRR